MHALRLVNEVVGVVFAAVFAYQLVYLLTPLFTRPKSHSTAKLHRYAVLIAARNEETVIGQLIDSIREQDYPAEYVTVCVVADNCTDDTATVAKGRGAVVYQRFDRVQVGKGYALDFLLTRLWEDYGDDTFDGYLVLDADNLLEPDYLTAMNKTFSDGYRVVTSYRNSKNYGDGWIAAGQSLCFLRESQFLNRSRMRLGTACVVTGTGFLAAHSLLKELGGWKCFLLSEDTEFTVRCLLRGERIGYCEDAVFYDEQPARLGLSCRQRMRWAKGYMQLFGRYGGKLLRGLFSKNGFACYDILMNNIPVIVLPLVSVVLNLSTLVYGLIHGVDTWDAVAALLRTGADAYILLFLMGAVTLFAEWRRIRATVLAKLWSLFTFPLYMFTFMPITVVAFFRKAEWKPIAHTHTVSLRELNGKGGRYKPRTRSYAENR